MFKDYLSLVAFFTGLRRSVRVGITEILETTSTSSHVVTKAIWRIINSGKFEFYDHKKRTIDGIFHDSQVGRRISKHNE
ncbi:CLUMA_CG005508, isoform A [Clunio marinus]|uniref:CLUMA_CG005508, isoform A n=1 Tax=Clunio marinus TaxID=568069 RepID=A0A1J1HUY4_9DIPT|nr:CLUMA_CG005508, isoform A [Clunio marinus]